MDTSMKDALAAAEAEEAKAKQTEADLRVEFEALYLNKAKADLDGLKIDKATEKRLASLRSQIQEAQAISNARTKRVKELRRLAVSQEFNAAKAERKKLLAAAVAESRKLDPLVQEIQAIRVRLLEIADQERAFVYQTNGELGLQGVDALQPLLPNAASMSVPFFNVEDWRERAMKARASFLDWE